MPTEQQTGDIEFWGSDKRYKIADKNLVLIKYTWYLKPKNECR